MNLFIRISVYPVSCIFISGCRFAAVIQFMSEENEKRRSGTGNFVICDIQKEYSEALLRILSEKLPGEYQLHLFHDIHKLKDFAERSPVEILLMAEEYTSEERRKICAKKRYLLTENRIDKGESELKETSDPDLEEKNLFRYQSVDKIIQIIMQKEKKAEKKRRVKREKAGNQDREWKGIIAIYSPVHRIGKTKFTLRLGKQIAQTKSVLYLNLEDHSGGEYYFPEKAALDMGDLLYYMKQKETNLGVRVSAMAGQLRGMDYLMPMEHSQDLKAVKGEEWILLLDMLLEKCIYDVILLDLGESVDGLYDILKKCVRIYMPYIEEGAALAKIEQYERNLKDAGYGEILSRTVRKRMGRAKKDDESRTVL